MAKKRYKFNPQTLTYEVMAIPFRIRFYRILRKVLIGFILASVVNLLFSFFFYTPKMYRIGERNNELMLKYNILNDKIRAATAKLQELRHRDNNVYRSLFAADSLNLHGIYTPYPDTKYSFLEGDMYTPEMIGTWRDLDAMTRMLYLESKSLDELEVLSKNKALMAEAIPAIWPLDRRKLRGNIGAFGTPDHRTGERTPGRRPGIEHRNAGLCHRGRIRRLQQRRDAGIRASDPAEPRIRLQNPLRPPEQNRSDAGAKGEARREDRGGRQYGTVERPPPALRSYI